MEVSGVGRRKVTFPEKLLVGRTQSRSVDTLPLLLPDGRSSMEVLNFRGAPRLCRDRFRSPGDPEERLSNPQQTLDLCLSSASWPAISAGDKVRLSPFSTTSSSLLAHSNTPMVAVGTTIADPLPERPALVVAQHNLLKPCTGLGRAMMLPALSSALMALSFATIRFFA
jgi:hypothetical protein